MLYIKTNYVIFKIVSFLKKLNGIKIMKNLFLIGTGGLFKEHYSYLLDYMEKNSNNINLKGIIDIKNSNRIDKFSKLKIYKENQIKNSKDVFLLLCLGDIEKRKKIINKFKNFQFFTLIHPSSYISPKAKIGNGCVISPGVIIAGNPQINDFNNLNFGSYISHDCILKKNNMLSPGTKIMGNCKIGENNFFGVDSVIIQNIKIGNNNILGANCTLLKNIKNNKTLVGTPAREVK